jgi:hypothetical protein
MEQTTRQGAPGCSKKSAATTPVKIAFSPQPTSRRTLHATQAFSEYQSQPFLFAQLQQSVSSSPNLRQFPELVHSVQRPQCTQANAFSRHLIDVHSSGPTRVSKETATPQVSQRSLCVSSTASSLSLRCMVGYGEVSCHGCDSGQTVFPAIVLTSFDGKLMKMAQVGSSFDPSKKIVPCSRQTERALCGNRPLQVP